ncbi:MAG: phosphohydrolase [Candidatus Cloacimonadota bacterium]|nr:phosphohydrolase [Candidatus Cloacimonadota bacterium]
MKKSRIQIKIEKKILSLLANQPKEVAEMIFADEEIQAYQDYANVVSIKRLGYNDHGPVHMSKAALNAIIMFDLLHNSGIKMNLEKEKLGGLKDSKIAVIISTLLHDIGMSTSRDVHELLGAIIAEPIVERLMQTIYPNDLKMKTIMKSIVLEGIIGHMGTHKINSIEAGLVLVGDGCDMEKGRSRITTLLTTTPRIGDIHKYSANSIDHVRISQGDKKPIKITVEMSQSVGFFQIEEVLYPKIASSPIKPYIELYGDVKNKKTLQYL